MYYGRKYIRGDNILINGVELQLKENNDTITATLDGEDVGFIQFLIQPYGMDGIKAIPEQMHVAEGYGNIL